MCIIKNTITLKFEGNGKEIIPQVTATNKKQHEEVTYDDEFARKIISPAFFEG